MGLLDERVGTLEHQCCLLQECDVVRAQCRRNAFEVGRFRVGNKHISNEPAGTAAGESESWFSESVAAERCLDGVKSGVINGISA